MPPRRLLLSLACLSLLTTAPLWIIATVKWPIDIDLLFYGTILNAFSEQLWSGDLYPRWLTGVNAGFGSPVFLFYSPLVFYAMSLFQWMSSLDPHGIYRVFLGMGLAQFLSGITCYRWLLRLFPETQARTGALLYAGFPYLLIHLFFSFGLAQLWAIACFPLLMETADRLARNGWRSLPGFSAAYAILSLTHLPSMLAFGVIPCLYAFAFASGRRIRTGGLLSVGIALAVAMSAIYLLPAIVNKAFISERGFLEGKFSYANSFLDMYSLIGIVLIVLPLLGFFLELPKGKRAGLMTRPVRVSLLVLAGLLFMLLPISKWIWDHVTPLHYLQWPSRFCNAMLPPAIVVAVTWLPHVRSRLLYPGLFAVGLIFSVAYSSHSFFFSSSKHTDTIWQYSLIPVPEYTTRWAAGAGLDFRRKIPQPFLDQPAVTVREGYAEASVVESSSRRIVIHANVTGPQAVLSLKRFYFPGWQASEGAAIEPAALLSLRMAGGERDIILTFPWFDGEHTGAAISLISLVIWLLLAFASRRCLPVEKAGIMH